MPKINLNDSDNLEKIAGLYVFGLLSGVPKSFPIIEDENMFAVVASLMKRAFMAGAGTFSKLAVWRGTEPPPDDFVERSFAIVEEVDAYVKRVISEGMKSQTERN